MLTESSVGRNFRTRFVADFFHSLEIHFLLRTKTYTLQELLFTTSVDDV